MDKAHKQTDLKLEEIENRLTAIYKRANKEIVATADEYFKQFEKQDKEQLKLLSEGKITEKEYKLWRKNKMMTGKRYKDMKEQTAEQLLHINETALAYINGELPEIYALNYNHLAETVDGVGGYSFTLTDADTIRNLAIADKTLLPYKYVNGTKDIRWNTKKVNVEVLQGILQGDSINKIADRLQRVTEMNRTSAIRNARTTVTSAECKGRQDSYSKASKDGIILKKEWMSTNDKRTRHWHADLNGVQVGVDESFYNDFGEIKYPADPHANPANVYNCRCTTVARVLGFVKAKVENAVENVEKTVESIEIKTRADAYKVLTEEIGFKKVEESTKYITEQILIENVEQLRKLNNKFKVISPNHKGSFSAENQGKAYAYVRGTFQAPDEQNMSLCSKYYSHSYDFFKKSAEKDILDGWCMPCSDAKQMVYTVTHEYGHMLEAKAVYQRIDIKKFLQKRSEMLDLPNGGVKSHNYAKKVETDNYKAIWSEIIDIAKKENPDFKIKGNLSSYGKTNYAEAFAETFANSQCGEPNELGKAMNIWLERNGF